MEKSRILSDIELIISLESSDLEGNYEEIERISLAAISDIKSSGLEIEGELYRFLDDFDIRRKDPAYRDYQTSKVADLLLRSTR